MKKSKIIYYLTGIIAFCSTAQADCDKEHWNIFKNNCGKSYDKDEEEIRMKIFQENCNKVNIHNEKYMNNQVTFNVKLNCRDSEWMQTQLKREEQGYRAGFYKNAETFTYDGSPLPDSFDWRTKKEIFPVTSKGNYSSSWAIATADILQDLCLMQTGTKICRPSVQELIDCCRGKRMDSAYDYIMTEGISTENQYPYTGEIGECKRNKSSRSVEISGYINIAPGDITALKSYIVKNGPVTAAVDESCWSYKHYNEGIYQTPECSSFDLNKAVLVLGYGIENGIEYWICKSTNGPNWGENGYIRIATKKNHCGVATEASRPIIKYCPPQ